MFYYELQGHDKYVNLSVNNLDIYSVIVTSQYVILLSSSNIVNDEMSL